MSKLKEVAEVEVSHDPVVAAIFQLALFSMMAEPMLKSKRKIKRVKTARPARYINPGDNHTARLYPRQSVRIVVDRPDTMQNVSEDAHWNFVLASPYLVLTNKTKNNKDQEVYEYSQIYDLTEWSKASEIYLGEIHYSLANNTHPEAEKASKGGSLMVYMIPEGGGRPDVLTIVNPDKYIVKLEPHRTMEVVLFKDWPKGHIDDWKVEITPHVINQESIFLTETAKTWVSDNHERGTCGDFNVVSRHTPPVNPLIGDEIRSDLTDELMTRPKPLKEHHFWFQFDPESQRRARSLKCGNYLVAKLTFTGTCAGISGSVKHEMMVSLNLHGKPVKVIDPEEGSMPAAEASKRILDRQRFILTNPGITDQIDWSSKTENYTIEIVAPNHLWPDEDPKARWEIEYDNNQVKDTYVTFCAIPSVTKGGVTFQRIQLMRRNLGNTTQTARDPKILGSIKVYYPRKPHIEESQRRISFWMVKDEPTSSNTTTNVRKKSDYNLYSGTSSSSYTSSSGEHWKANVGRYDRPKRSMVTIEEIPLAPLEDNARTRKLSDVSLYDEESYYRGNYGNYFRGAVIAKKNETMDRSQTCPVIGNPTRIGNSPDTTTGTTHTRTSTSLSTIQGTEEIYLFNPAHLQEVTLFPGQVLVLRVSQPEDMAITAAEKEKCRGELWNFSAIQLGDHKPGLENHRTTRLSTEKYRQEVCVKINESHLPDMPGSYNAGAIHLTASGISRILRLTYKKGESAPSVYTPPKIGRLLNNLMSHEAAGRKYEYATQWRHEDSVVLDPETSFYVMNPESTNEWPGEWMVQLTPCPIDLRVWSKLSPSITNLSDRQRPWFKRDMPAQLNRTLYFKPLSMSCNADMKTFLTELAKITGAEYYPVATLTYTNRNKKFLESSIDGSCEQVTTCSRRMYIYVKLPVVAEEYKGQSHSFEPENGHQINVNVKDEVTIKLRTSMGAGGIQRWSGKEYPGGFLQYHGQSMHTSEFDSFRYTAFKAGSGELNFNAAGRTMSIVVQATEKR